MIKRLKKIAILTSLLMILSTFSVFAASFTTLAAFQAEVTRNFTARQTSFVINYTGNTNELGEQFKDVFNKAINSDDYLHYSLKAYSSSLNGVTGNVNTIVTASYVDTAEQEAYVTKQVPIILAQIITTNMTDAQKVKAIYDWLITNVKYDYTLTKYSAYDALMGSSVCQGYALLMNKMVVELGIPTHMVIGTLEDVAHAWNQCEIEGVWYFFDATNGVNNKAGYFGQSTIDLTNKKFIWVKTDYPVVTSEYLYNEIPAVASGGTAFAVTPGWKLNGGTWSYIKSDGTKQTGWVQSGLKWYYLGSNGDMATGWDLINGKWYYLNPSGEMVTGWDLINMKWYYLDPSGDMAIGWKLLEKTWYYLNPTSGAMVVNTKVGGYYLGSTGAMK